MASAKQIAARKLFVKRVRAGEFTRAKKRATNPVEDSPVLFWTPKKRYYVAEHSDTARGYGVWRKNGMLPMGSRSRLEDAVSFAVQLENKSFGRKNSMVHKNPNKKRTIARKGTAKIGRVSQITKRPPTKRLKARRAANSRPGYFPNPRPLIRGKDAYPYKVEKEHGGYGKWKCIAQFQNKEDAFAYARAYNAHYKVRVRVVQE